MERSRNKYIIATSIKILKYLLTRLIAKKKKKIPLKL